jgi:hypothetical protein
MGLSTTQAQQVREEQMLFQGAQQDLELAALQKQEQLSNEQQWLNLWSMQLEQAANDMHSSSSAQQQALFLPQQQQHQELRAAHETTLQQQAEAMQLSQTHLREDLARAVEKERTKLFLELEAETARRPTAALEQERQWKSDHESWSKDSAVHAAAANISAQPRKEGTSTFNTRSSLFIHPLPTFPTPSTPLPMPHVGLGSIFPSLNLVMGFAFGAGRGPVIPPPGLHEGALAIHQ